MALPCNLNRNKKLNLISDEINQCVMPCGEASRGGGSTHHSIMSYHERLLTHVDGIRWGGTPSMRDEEPDHAAGGCPAALFRLFTELSRAVGSERALASHLGRLVGVTGQSLATQMSQVVVTQVGPDPICVPLSSFLVAISTGNILHKMLEESVRLPSWIPPALSIGTCMKVMKPKASNTQQQASNAHWRVHCFFERRPVALLGWGQDSREGSFMWHRTKSLSCPCGGLYDRAWH